MSTSRSCWVLVSTLVACGGGGAEGDAAPATDAAPPDAAPRALGAACDLDAECGSGLCVAGTCCGARCDQPCETGACGGDGACAPAAATTTCRPSAGACDPAEACDGVTGACPADVLADAAVECRATAGDCDVAEACTGTAAACPDDGFAEATTCGTYVCAGDAAACPTTCASDDDCAIGAHCIDGTCQASKWAFTTSTTTNGNIGGLAGADALCQGRADAAGRRGTYKAWLSDSAASPSTRFTQATTPYRLPLGATSSLLLANDWADLIDGTIANRFIYTEAGATVPDNIPFTCTTATGTRTNDNHCSNWTSIAGTGAYGNTGGLEYTWTASGAGGACNVLHRLYCFEQ